MSNDLDRPVVGLTYSGRELGGFELWRYLFHGFVAAGTTPISIDCSLDQPGIAALVGRLDGLVVTGGGDVDPVLYGGDWHDSALRGVNRLRDANECAALDAAIRHGLPVLAICRGMQLLNVVLGGTLHADLGRDRPGAVVHNRSYDELDQPGHEVEIARDSLLAEWLGSDGVVPVNTAHHQGIRDLSPDLTASAIASDGLIEAVECRRRRLLGVQWHPEILWPFEPSSAALLRGFTSQCRLLAPTPLPT